MWVEFCNTSLSHIILKRKLFLYKARSIQLLAKRHNFLRTAIFFCSPWLLYRLIWYSYTQWIARTISFCHCYAIITKHWACVHKFFNIINTITQLMIIYTFYPYLFGTRTFLWYLWISVSATKKTQALLFSASVPSEQYVIIVFQLTDIFDVRKSTCWLRKYWQYKIRYCKG